MVFCFTRLNNIAFFIFDVSRSFHEIEIGGFWLVNEILVKETQKIYMDPNYIKYE